MSAAPVSCGDAASSNMNLLWLPTCAAILTLWLPVAPSAAEPAAQWGWGRGGRTRQLPAPSLWGGGAVLGKGACGHLMPAALPALLPPHREPLELIPDQGRDRGEAGAALSELPRHPNRHGPALRLQRHDVLLHPARRHLLPLGHRWESPPAPLRAAGTCGRARSAGPHVCHPRGGCGGDSGVAGAAGRHRLPRSRPRSRSDGAARCALTSRRFGIFSSPGAEEPPRPSPAAEPSGAQPPGLPCSSAGVKTGRSPRVAPGVASAGGSGVGGSPAAAQPPSPSLPLPIHQQLPVTAGRLSPGAAGRGVLPRAAAAAGARVIPGAVLNPPVQPCPCLTSCPPRAASGLDPVPAPAAATVPA